MTLRCAHCGSQNHQAFDCSRKGETYVPTAADLEADKTELQRHDESQVEMVAQGESAVGEPVFEPSPRWPGALPVCTAENLPAYEDEAAVAIALSHFQSHLVRKWPCLSCGKWHYLAVPRGASGSSSGHERTSSYPRPNFQPFIRRQTREAQRHQSGDLPVQKVAATEPPKRTLGQAKEKTYVKARRDGDLF